MPGMDSALKKMNSLFCGSNAVNVKEIAKPKFVKPEPQPITHEVQSEDEEQAEQMKKCSNKAVKSHALRLKQLLAKMRKRRNNP